MARNLILTLGLLLGMSALAWGYSYGAIAFVLSRHLLAVGEQSSKGGIKMIVRRFAIAFLLLLGVTAPAAADSAIAGGIKMPGAVHHVPMTPEKIAEEERRAVVLVITTWPLTKETIDDCVPPSQREAAEAALARGDHIDCQSFGSGVVVASAWHLSFNPSLSSTTTYVADQVNRMTYLTNCHVVKAKAGKPYPADLQIEVKSFGVKDGVPAQLIEAHPDIDICVLRNDEPVRTLRGPTIPCDSSMLKSLPGLRAICGKETGLPLPPTSTAVDGIRPYKDLKMGEPVYALGNPVPGRETLSWSLTNGIISALRPEMGDLIQIDAPITHGNSGGALFDQYGNLIGITSQGYKNVQGFNFAIAADLVWRRYGR